MVGNNNSGRSKTPIKIIQLTQDGFSENWSFTQTEWQILCYIALENNTVKTISEACFYNIAETTIRRTIEKFKCRNLIKLSWHKQGKTKRQNIFEITSFGEEAYISYLSSIK